ATDGADLAGVQTAERAFCGVSTDHFGRGEFVWVVKPDQSVEVRSVKPGMVAAGEKLPFTQRQISIHGHALECRINAEDPFKFTPSPGRITMWHAPGGPGVRVDSHVYTNYFVPPHYDSMIGKIIVHGDTREQAIARMRTALAEMVVEGINTNVPLHRELMVDAKFMEGGTNIHYLEHWLADHKR
ncbi:MAG: hypothetical protein RJA29_2858, partial [Pseudomonadota bacterium]